MVWSIGQWFPNGMDKLDVTSMNHRASSDEI